jgi:hypothetical protein
MSRGDADQPPQGVSAGLAIAALALRALQDEAPGMLSPRLRVIGLRLAPACLLLLAGSLGCCRKLLGGSEQTSMGDIEANLDRLIAVTKTGLDLQVSPRFMTFGPLPTGSPWDSPVAGSQTFEAHGQRISFKTGRDGLIRERYEARACPLREIWSCVEIWATGRFGKDGGLACVGLRLEKGDTIEKRKLDMRIADNCPFMTTTPGPAQQVVRGIEKAQLQHTQAQEPNRYLDPKAE